MIVQDLKYMYITYESGLILKDQLMAKLEKWKQSQEIWFNDITNLVGEKIQTWLITFVNVNEEYHALAS